METLSRRIETVDALRGIAAFAVCFGHLTNGNTGFLPDGILKSVGSYGWLGVETFFVISGFIIPYSLHRSRYTINRYGVFLLKRLIRLDPPYIATILLIIPLGYLAAMAPGFQGPPFQLSIAQLLLHFGYLNAFFNYDWLNPVFWTLAIEFQYYVLVGLLLPMISHPHFLVRGGLFALLSLIAIFSPQERFVFHWLFLFMLGMLAFQFHAGIIKRVSFVVWVCALAGGACYTLGSLIAAVGVSATIAIAFLKFGGKILLFFGAISYSLYLIHVPVGMKFVNLGSRFATSMVTKLILLSGALAVTIAAAYALYTLVERPAQRWSAAIKYRRPETCLPDQLK